MGTCFVSWRLLTSVADFMHAGGCRGGTARKRASVSRGAETVYRRFLLQEEPQQYCRTFLGGCVAQQLNTTTNAGTTMEEEGCDARG